MNKYIIIILIIIIIKTVPLLSVSTKYWEQSSLQDFSKGEIDKTAIKGDGKVILSYDLEGLFEEEEVYIWSMATDKKTSIFAGTGDEGRIYIVGQKTELYAELPAPHITALFHDGKILYAGTSPRGEVYQITGKDNARLLTKLEVDYIWGMYKKKGGNLYVTTGNPGNLIKIDSKGNQKIVFESSQSHLFAIASDKNGDVYFGSYPDGIIFKHIINSSKTEVVYDCPENEVKSLIIDEKGIIYAGTSSKQFSLKMPQLTDKTFISYTVSQEKNESDSDTSSKSSSQSIYKYITSKKVINRVYKIEDGVVDVLFEKADAVFLSLSSDPDGSIIIGTGDNGEIFKITKDKKIIKLYETETLQILSMIYNKKLGNYIGTGNLGNVYRLRFNYSPEGNFISEVHDTKSKAKWGTPFWESESPDGTSIKMEFRTGDTEIPNKLWNAWKECKIGNKINCPPARFIQYRAILKTTDKNKTPALGQIKIPYIIKNNSPSVVELKMEKRNGKEKEGENSKLSKYKLKLQKDPDPFQLKFSWEAEDPDSDKMEYSILFKMEKDKKWHKLVWQLTEEDYSFDSRMLEDGKYIFRIVASDIPSNPVEKALNGHLDSNLVIIDNTAPEFNSVSLVKDDKYFEITGNVKDKHSVISKIEYSEDTKIWRDIHSVDDVFDSSSEKFKFRLNKEEIETDLLIIKVYDDQGNSSANRVWLTR